ncbi:hypothetical protein Q7P37_004497 [Cladosporium fusiforme]
MASRIPVTIESSPSDQIYRVPSITPDTLRRSTSNASLVPSSPQLASPSSFVRPRAPPLKSGSRAQQVPAGANAGFASAANIWRAQEQNTDSAGQFGDAGSNYAEDGTAERQIRTGQTKGTGKLSRPKKTPKTRNESGIAPTEPDIVTISNLAEAHDISTAVPGEDGKRSSWDTAPPHKGVTSTRRPSINLSEYSFDAGRTSEELARPSKKAPASPKPARKRAAKKTETGDASTRKKSRKATAKSEAIILNSDEPEVFLSDSKPRETSKPSKSKKPAPGRPVATAVRTSKDSDRAVLPSQEEKHTSSVQCAKYSSEQSAYFAHPQPALDERRILASPPPPLRPADPAALPTDVMAQEAKHANGVATEAFTGPAPPTVEVAPRRRRSWTPVKDPSADNTMSQVNYELNEKMDKIPFSEMLGNFSYMQSEAPTAQRIITAEGGTKRRRVELSNAHTLPQPQSLDTAQPKIAPKTTKKPKAPKKAQTITALATAAFQPAMPPEPVQSTVSAFFTPQKETALLPEVNYEAEADAPVNVKKARKPRAKAKTADDAVVASVKSAKPRAKPKSKAKINPADHQLPLYSPSQARKELKSQDFLFGTSSQLAAEESPDFIREIQTAVRQSEMMSVLPGGSQLLTQMENNSMCDERSFAKVPTAPHGTCLSIEQAHRELWRIAARDAAGAKLAQESRDLLCDEALTDNKEDPIQREKVAENQSPIENSGALPEEAESYEDAAILNNEPTIDPAIAENNKPKTPIPEEDWMFLQSDDSEILPQPLASKSPERPAALPSLPTRRTALQALDANINIAMHDTSNKSSTLGQSRPFSTVTTNCRINDLNTHSIIGKDDASLVTQSSPRGRGRPRKVASPELSLMTSPAHGRGRPRKTTSQNVSPAVSPARGRGRPRKDTSPKIPPAASPARGRGRPRKDTSPKSLPLASPAPVADRPRKKPIFSPQSLTSPARGRGRPRKHPLVETGARTSPVRSPGRPRKAATTEVTATVSPPRPVGRPRKDRSGPSVLSKASSKERNPHHTTSASQPVQNKGWTNIDEISDSETPATPSPRRRRASSSPAFVRPLEFSFPRSPSPKLKAVASSASALKVTDDIWPTVQASIFPKIFQTIKSTPPSEDIKAPSWHEKILLYDPIVLEDLTAWLNKQGLRTEVNRLKPKTKTRGRKKKDAPPEVDEWEVVKDELKAWMVQKWCEDQSICCLWKEGLRGGVKARY